MPNGIVIFGANGSGKTTLGRELARVLNLKHVAAEDYCFDNPKSHIPNPALKIRRYDFCLPI